MQNNVFSIMDNYCISEYLYLLGIVYPFLLIYDFDESSRDNAYKLYIR